MARTQTERLSEKTIERQFLYELERDFELAPATSRAVLEAAKQVLLSSASAGGVREGQIRVTAVSVDEPAGKPPGMMKTTVKPVDNYLNILYNNKLTSPGGNRVE